MKIKSTFLFLFFSILVFSQQEEKYSQYMYNPIIFNPAYAGSRENTNVFLMHRSQWVGFDGAPTTSNFTFDTRVNDEIGLGLTFINDQIGPSNENNLSLDFSYGFPVNEEYRLTFGLKTSANLLNINFSKLNGIDPGDIAFSQNIENQFSPNFGVGVYLNSDKAYFGISSPKLLKTNYFDRNSGVGESKVVKKEIHLYFIAGYVFDVNDEIKFKPSLLTKAVQGSPLQVDVSANFLFNEKLAVGMSYGLNTSFNAMTAFNISDIWTIGYAYGKEISKITAFNNSSHEVFLKIQLFNNFNSRVVYPRFF